MPKITFPAGENHRTGYLSLPPSGRGAGLLLLHAWWGLTPFFEQLGERLAEEGFVVFAPDLHHGRTAQTIDEAEQILAGRDFAAVQETALAALTFLQNHEAVTGTRLGAVGFSMGVQFALLLEARSPGALSAIVDFYGASGVDLASCAAAWSGHYGEVDEWEPLAQVLPMRDSGATIYTYPGAGHWFFESDRSEHFVPEASALAWERTVTFLKAHVD